MEREREKKRKKRNWIKLDLLFEGGSVESMPCLRGKRNPCCREVGLSGDLWLPGDLPCSQHRPSLDWNQCGFDPHLAPAATQRWRPALPRSTLCCLPCPPWPCQVQITLWRHSFLSCLEELLLVWVMLLWLCVIAAFSCHQLTIDTKRWTYNSFIKKYWQHVSRWYYY